MTTATPKLTRAIETFELKALTNIELDEVCTASETAIEDGGGFGWVTIPERPMLERFWQGVIAAPFRRVFVAKLDGVICATVQLVRYPRSNEAQAMNARVVNFFVAPWARSYGVGRQLLETLEGAARRDGYMQLQLDVRQTQAAAIGLFSSIGFKRWGENPHYAYVDEQWITGYYFAKILQNERAES